jgi:hypothetical protein
MNLWEDAKFQFVEQNSIECWCNFGANLYKKLCYCRAFYFDIYILPNLCYNYVIELMIDKLGFIEGCNEKIICV